MIQSIERMRTEARACALFLGYLRPEWEISLPNDVVLQVR